MAKYWIDYSENQIKSPLSFWVHQPIDAEIWDYATRFEPPLQQKVLGKGYPIFCIEYKKHTLVFVSTNEIEHCTDVLSQKHLPTTQSLAEKSWVKGYQHLHWLTKWPGNIKSYNDRKEILKLLAKLKLLKP